MQSPSIMLGWGCITKESSIRRISRNKHRKQRYWRTWRSRKSWHSSLSWWLRVARTTETQMRSLSTICCIMGNKWRKSTREWGMSISCNRRTNLTILQRSTRNQCRWWTRRTKPMGSRMKRTLIYLAIWMSSHREAITTTITRTNNFRETNVVSSTTKLSKGKRDKTNPIPFSLTLTAHSSLSWSRKRFHSWTIRCPQRTSLQCSKTLNLIQIQTTLQYREGKTKLPLLKTCLKE